MCVCKCSLPLRSPQPVRACVCVLGGGGSLPTEHVHIPLKPNSINTGYLFTANPHGGNAASGGGAQQAPSQETCLLPDLGCPGKGWEAAGRSCRRQARRQAALPGISLHHLDQTRMVKQPLLPSLPSALPRCCPHAPEGRSGDAGCSPGCLPASLPGSAGLARHPCPVGTCQRSPREGAGPSPVEKEEETHVV